MKELIAKGCFVLLKLTLKFIEQKMAHKTNMHQMKHF
jgi:hypothetical protein